MATAAVFPGAARSAGMYESFYLRAVAPERALGVWIRHTVHKRPGKAPTGSVWFTLFDRSSQTPLMHKLTSGRLTAPPDGWIAIGPDRDAHSAQTAGGARMAPGLAQGVCGPASWSLDWSSEEPELRHLGPELLYRAPLPRTKLTSPAPAASFNGAVTLAGQAPIEVRGWPGMVGHNWGSEHAERWIWLHVAGFAEEPAAWLDVALGRVRLGRWTTPWVCNGAVSLEGVRRRIGGLAARGLRVAETPAGCALRLPGEGGLSLGAMVEVSAGSAAGWRYADPDGGGHDVVNCSIAALELNVRAPGREARSLHSGHGAAYELGMREQDHGVQLAPFEDG